MLTNVQKDLLDNLAGVLQYALVYQAVTLNLISGPHWRGGISCLLDLGKAEIVKRGN
jgi:hypothetical protein